MYGVRMVVVIRGNYGNRNVRGMDVALSDRGILLAGSGYHWRGIDEGGWGVDGCPY
jgi:hypothetical protein